MIAITPSDLELLRVEILNELVRSPGPCVTIYLPSHRPGDATSPAAGWIKSSAQAALRKLTEVGLSKAAAENLLEPLQRPGHESGSHWSRAIFCSPAMHQQFLSTQPLKPFLKVAGCFGIKALLGEPALPRAFYILAPSKSGVALLRCTGLRAEPAQLPSGVPSTLDESLAFEPPDHTLENRSPSGASTGSMRHVRFGTGSDREREHVHLADFYKIVDRAIQEMTRGSEIPLVLAGVDEDTALYRNAAGYKALAAGTISGSFDVEREPAELLGRAYAILFENVLNRNKESFTAARERTAPARFTSDLEAILSAAFDGRVAELYLGPGAEKTGLIERGAYQSWGEEDLWNLAAVQVIAHRGKALALPAGSISGRSPGAAILRF